MDFQPTHTRSREAMSIGQLLQKHSEMQSSLPTLQRKSVTALAVIERYGNDAQFLTVFNPAMQSVYATDKYRCFKGTAPSLGVLAQAYDQSTADAWIEIQLRDLSEYSGCREKLSIEQLSEIARVIRVEWGYLKVTELMYFFHKFKAGAYGKFYGAVDGLVITSAIQDFMEDRRAYLTRLEQEEQKKADAVEEEAHRKAVDEFRRHYMAVGMKPCEYLDFCKKHQISYEEMDEIGWLFKMGYEPETLRWEKTIRSSSGGIVGMVKRLFGKT